MVGTRCIALGLLSLVAGGTSAQADYPGCFGPWPAVAYYYALPWPGYPCPSGPLVIPVPDARPYPKKTPMPTAKTGEPRAPVITATRTPGNSFTPGIEPLAKERCRVGFWNLSGRDVTLVIEGKSWTLARDRSVTLDLQREFAWQVDQQPQHVERIPEGKASHEVVIR